MDNFNFHCIILYFPMYYYKQVLTLKSENYIEHIYSRNKSPLILMIPVVTAFIFFPFIITFIKRVVYNQCLQFQPSHHS